MATTSTKTKKSTSTKSTREKIVQHYQDYLLTHGEAPPTVYSFCKELKIEEGQFYQHFANFGQISTAFWTELFRSTVKRLEGTEEYAEFAVREKLLSFYFGFFEHLKNHRSYALLTLRDKMFSPRRDLHDLSELKKDYKLWIKQLVAEGKSTEEIASRTKLTENYDTLYWYQFIFLLDFWSRDNSPGFERSDEAIEKTVNLSFDLIEKNALDSAFDFGKFIFQNMR